MHKIVYPKVSYFTPDCFLLKPSSLIGCLAKIEDILLPQLQNGLLRKKVKLGC